MRRTSLHRSSALSFTVSALALAAGALVSGPREARADEGMWPFNMVPRAQIQKTHEVALNDPWLDHVRLASVRFNVGGSGSFVSKTGLVLTNHHVAADCIDKLSSPEHDYREAGFLAGRDGAHESRCPDLELNVLVAIEDVTEQVRAARKDGMNEADANTAVKGAMSQIEKTCTQQTQMRCDVVTLYAGGKYNLYTYKKYTDVRLVFAPEVKVAFFGGDKDNFTYPRFNVDMALFRVYENGQPIVPKEYLKWNPIGPKEGDTVFVSGHPGSTGRLNTMAELTRLRDTVYPYSLQRLAAMRDALKAYGKQSKENERQASLYVMGVENSLKAITGFESGLKDPALMKKKADDEAALRKAIEADPKLKSAYLPAFDEIAKAQQALGTFHVRLNVLEETLGSDLLSIGRRLVRLPDELATPNEKRLRDYRESNLESLKLKLFSPAPLYGGIEQLRVRLWLERLQRDLGANDPLVRKVLAGRTPAFAAQEIVAGSKLTDVYARRRLFDGGKTAIAASNDPVIVLMRDIDAAARAMHKREDDEVEAPMRNAGQLIAQATFAVHGDSAAPDATFTLRLSPGVVKGYEEKGKKIPWYTDFAGFYAKATGVAPYQLPPRWLKRKSSVNGATPMNFVSTNDIIGGNSGSPVVNTNCELVGLIFDGNISSLPNRFVYSEVTGRAVSVSTAGMLEALKNVYEADALLGELVAN